jgi:hypothetical protein
MGGRARLHTWWYVCPHCRSARLECIAWKWVSIHSGITTKQRLGAQEWLCLGCNTRFPAHARERRCPEPTPKPESERKTRNGLDTGPAMG